MIKKLLVASLLAVAVTCVQAGPVHFERTGATTLRGTCGTSSTSEPVAQCDYNLSGNALFFSDQGVNYAYALIKDDFGTYSRALMHQVGTSYLAYGPYIEDAITDESIMAYGSVYDYLANTLAGANSYFMAKTQPQCPASQTNKRDAAAFDISMGTVVWNTTTRKLEIHLAPPLPHTLCPK